MKYKLLLFQWKKFLKNGACVFLSTVFFSKSFGGKICHNWTDVTYTACEKLIRQKIVQQLIKKKTKVQLNHDVTFAYVKPQISSIF